MKISVFLTAAVRSWPDEDFLKISNIMNYNHKSFPVLIAIAIVDNKKVHIFKEMEGITFQGRVS